jgi:hypothetical protein
MEAWMQTSRICQHTKSRKNYWKFLAFGFVLLGFLAICCPRAIGHRLTGPNLYGSALRGDGLGNVPLRPNSYGAQVISFRFRAPISGQATSVIYYNQQETKRQYAKGDGGIVLLELRNDDGTSNHWPSQTILASSTLHNPVSASFFPTLKFDKPARIDEGKIYHIVFANVSSNPKENYVSVNCLHNFRARPNVNMDVGIAGTDLAVLVKDGTADIWRARNQSTPIFNLFFSDGRAIGQGYASAISGWNHTMNSTNKVRETFVVKGSGKTVSRVSVRVSRESGDLNVRLENQDGSLIEEGDFPGYKCVPDKIKMCWCSYEFKSPHVLEAGKTYNLVLHSQNGSYSTFGLLKGRRYGFLQDTFFSDGWAQYSADGGNSWQDYNYAGPTRDVDLQFYFTLVD